eukprot:9298285-Pyramimonas_sp.AAC.1
MPNPSGSPTGDIIESREGVQVPVEAAEAVAMRAPGLPSKEEQEKHNLTHIPYAPRCDSCVIGRRQEEAHRRR